MSDHLYKCFLLPSFPGGQVCLGTGAKYSSVHVYVRERGGRKGTGRQKVSQALMNFIKLGYHSLDTIMNKMTKGYPSQHFGST